MTLFFSSLLSKSSSRCEAVLQVSAAALACPIRCSHIPFHALPFLHLDLGVRSGPVGLPFPPQRAKGTNDFCVPSFYPRVYPVTFQDTARSQSFTDGVSAITGQPIPLSHTGPTAATPREHCTLGSMTILGCVCNISQAKWLAHAQPPYAGPPPRRVELDRVRPSCLRNRQSRLHVAALGESESKPRTGA